MCLPVRNSIRAAVLGLLLWPAICPVAAAAPFGVADETAESLLAELGDRYDVIVLSRGYVVRPVSSSAGFEQIELDEAGVLVDGELYDPEALRELLGEDAEILFALTGDASALRGLEEIRLELEENQRESARELEERIRRQVEELERLDSDRLKELDDVLGERRNRRSRRMRRTETRVALGSSLTVGENESARDVVVILGPLDVRGEVRGDSVVVLGSAEINGRLDGELTVVGGNVSIGPDAVVDGNINCVGGVIHRAPGAEVDGDITEVSVAPFSIDIPGFEFEGWTPFDGWRWNDRRFKWFDFAGTVFGTVLLGVLIVLTVLVARKRVDSVAERARAEPWKSGLIGFVVEVLIAPVLMLVSLLLVISVVGIPVLMVLLPLTFLVILILLFLGYAGVAVALGRALRSRRFDLGRMSPFVAVLIGLLLVQSWQILGEGLTFAGGVIRFTGYMLIAVGFFLKYLAWTVGLGAVMLDRFSPLPATDPYLPPPAPLPDLDEVDDGGRVTDQEAGLLEEAEDVAEEAGDGGEEAEPDGRS